MSKRLLLLTVVLRHAIMNLFVLSQMLVAMAFVCDIVSFQFPDRKTILACLVASTGLSSAHYFLLLSPSAGCLMLLAAQGFQSPISASIGGGCGSSWDWRPGSYS